MSIKRVLLPGAILLLALLLTWLLLFWHPDQGHQTLPGLTDAPTGGDFTLQSEAGEVSLQGLRGKVVILYFGYTWCPDICPTSLSLLTMALNELTPEQLTGVQALFISVDPERDTLPRLKEYAAYFHPALRGVTGSEQQLQQIARQYGAAYRVVKQDSATGYLVDHSADLYLIDRQGRLAQTLAHGTPPEQILAALQKLLKQ